MECVTHVHTMECVAQRLPECVSQRLAETCSHHGVCDTETSRDMFTPWSVWLRECVAQRVCGTETFSGQSVAHIRECLAQRVCGTDWGLLAETCSHRSHHGVCGTESGRDMFTWGIRISEKILADYFDAEQVTWHDGMINVLLIPWQWVHCLQVVNLQALNTQLYVPRWVLH